MKKLPAPIGQASGAPTILMVRGKRVILDSELAALYGVPTKQLNQQVRRNAKRFPRDFAFLLSSDGWESLRSQIATLKTRRGVHRKFFPYAVTEHGVLMAAGVLNSKRAIEVSIYIVRTLVAMREAIATHEELSKRLDELERRCGGRVVVPVLGDGEGDRGVVQGDAAIRIGTSSRRSAGCQLEVTDCDFKFNAQAPVVSSSPGTRGGCESANGRQPRFLFTTAHRQRVVPFHFRGCPCGNQAP